MKRFFIRSLEVLSPYGIGFEEFALNIGSKDPQITYCDISQTTSKNPLPTVQLSASKTAAIHELFLGDEYFEKQIKRLDRVTLLAIGATKLLAKKNLHDPDTSLGSIFCSSRGATTTIEEQINHYSERGSVAVLTSPLTTFGSIATYAAAAYQKEIASEHLHFDFSMTCASGLLGIINAIMWLKSGYMKNVIVGATEAAITPFTLAQLVALGIYTEDNSRFPCRPLAINATSNTFMLGEGSVSCMLDSTEEENVEDTAASYVGEIVGFGSYQEIHGTVTGTNSHGFFTAMNSAIEMTKKWKSNFSKDSGRPPLHFSVIPHAPGTLQGDATELEAIRKLNLPVLSNYKWMTGHTFSASGLMGIAAHVATQKDTQHTIPFPSYVSCRSEKKENEIILVNSAGFGGIYITLAIQFSKNI